jgi:dTMP kinase
MYKQNFFFIVFEGVEGTGKSYQINKLYKNLKKKNLKIIKTREPGGVDTAEKIRKLIFNKDSNKFDKITDFYLMLASRNEHFIKKLLPAKKKNLIVISDRFTDSTFCYQVVGNKISLNVNRINQKYILNNFKPNLTFILRSDLKSVKKRLNKRKVLNKFDNLNFSFYKKVQNSFVQIAKKNKKDYVLIDSSLNNEVAEEKIFAIIKKKLKLK